MSSNLNLLELLLPQLQSSLAPEVAKRLGIDESLVKQAMTIAIPILISALSRNAESKKGAQSLSNALEKDHDGSVLSSADAVLSQYTSGDGNAILGHIFGSKKEGVEQAVTASTGIDGSALLQILAPAVMGALGQTKSQQGLDATGVADLLKTEEKQIEQKNSDVAQIATQILDSNKDGSVIDDVIGLVGKFLKK